VITALENRIGALLAGFVARVDRHALRALLAALGLAAAGGVYASQNLGVLGDPDLIFDENLPFRVDNDLLKETFPASDEDMLVVIDAPTRAQAEEAAEALADRVRMEPETFASVLTPGVGPFFARHGLLYLDAGDLEELADHLADAQPLLAEVARDPSLRGFLGLLTRLVERGASSESAGSDVAVVFDAVAGALADAERLESRRRTFEHLILGGDGLDAEETRRFAVIRPRLDYDAFVAAGAALPRLREIVKELELGSESEVRARITGEIALQTEELDRVQRQAVAAGVASFVMVSIILGFALRSSRLILATLLSLVVGLACTFGFAAVAIGHLNLISTAFAVLFIGLGVDFGIHFCSRYQELRSSGAPHGDSLDATARGVGSSLALCATTTSIGFFAFVPTDYLGVAELGLISGTGMLISLLATITVVPATLSLRRREGPGVWSTARALALPTLPARRPALVCGAALLLAVAGAWLAPRWHFDASPLRVRDPGTESLLTFQELVAGGDLNPWSIDVVADDLSQAEVLAGRLGQLESVKEAVTLASYVPTQQQEKLEILEDVSLFLGPALAARPVEAPTLEQQVHALHDFRQALARAEFESPAVAGSAARVSRALDSFIGGISDSDRDGVRVLEENLVDPLVDGFGRLRTALSAGPVASEDLPQELRTRLLSASGLARIEVRPREDLNDDRALRRFVAEVTGVAPRATGTAVYMLESGKVVVDSLRQALVSALIAVALLLCVLWRSLRDATLALAPLLLAALLTAASSVLVGLPINFADVIVLPLLLGIGIDSGIHLVQRHRSEGDTASELLHTSTSRAVFWSALTTIASFGSLAFASHRGMSSLGQLLALGVSLTLACNLLVLPALIALSDRGRARRAGPRPQAGAG
jgi:hopanoid biosynthesis associated RND transporter like protein HpnN